MNEITPALDLTPGPPGHGPVAGRVLFQSAAAAVVYRVLNVATGIVSLPLLLAALTQSDFGVWIVMSQSVSLLALSDLGAGNAIGRFVARHRGLDDAEGLSEVLSTVMAILLTAAVVVALATIVLAPYVPGWVGVSAERQAQAADVFIIIGLGVAAQLPLRVAMGVLIGYQLYGPHAIGKIAESVLTLAGIVALYVSHRLGLVTLAIASAAAAVTAQLILLLVAWRMTRPWRLSSRLVTRPMARRLLGMGGSVLVMTSAAMLYTQGTGILAGRLIGVAGVAIYGVALTVVGNLHPLITSIAIPLATLSSEWQARNDLDQLRRTSLLVMRLTFSTSVCIAVGLFFFGEPALRWWLWRSGWSDADFTQAGRALSVMGFALAVGLPHVGSRATLQGVGRHWLVGTSVLAASAVSLACGAAAMAAGWGVVGAAIGWSVVWVIQGTVLFPPLIARYLREPVGDMVRRVYVPGVCIGLAVAATGWFMNGWLKPHTVTEQIVTAVPCIAVSCLGLLAIAPSGWAARLGIRRA